MIYLHLLFIFMKISLFSFGGAYSFIPLIEKEIVEKNNWLDKKEFLDVLGMVEISPGAISIKFASYVGFKKAGIVGAIIANIGNFLLPALFIVLIAVFYKKLTKFCYFNSAMEMINITIIAMILAIGFKFLFNVSIIDGINFTTMVKILVLIITFLLFLFSKIHPAYLIMITGIIGILLKLTNNE